MTTPAAPRDSRRLSASLRRIIRLFAATLGLYSVLIAAEAPKKAFDVPADFAANSLKQFSEQSGLEVIFPSETAKGIRTQAVKGTMTAREALDSMLANTGLAVVRDERTGAFTISRVSDPKIPRAAQASPSSVRPNRSANNDATSHDDNDPIELSPFTVNADKDVGYVAANSLAGSRLNTPLRDTAATISVMTAEFLSDIGATSLTEALEWGNNVQLTMSDDAAIGAGPNPNGFFNQADGFRVRGIGATITRNYFAWPLPTDNYNVERIEESRGPNSILFGIGSAGGIINIATKQAVTGRSFRRGTATVGSYGSYRGAMDVNQSSDNRRLAVRLNALYDHTASWKTYGFSNRRRIHLAASYNITSGTRLRAEYETGDNHENISAGSSAEDGGATKWLASGRPTYPNAIPVPNPNPLVLGRYAATRITYVANTDSLMNMGLQNFGNAFIGPVIDESVLSRTVNSGGPGQLRDSHFNAVSVFLEQKVGRATFIELAYNHQDTHSLTYQAFGNSPSLTFDPTGTLPAPAGTTLRPPNPFVGQLMFDGPWRRLPNHARSDNTRLTVSTERDFGRWGSYRLAAMGEYEARASRSGPQFEVWAGHPFNAQPENAANQVFRRNYATEGVWSTYYANGPAHTGPIVDRRDPVTGRTLSSTWVAQNADQRDQPNYQKVLLLGAQARYFQSRLVLGAGYRHDALDVTTRGTMRDPVTNGIVVDYGNNSDSSYTGRTRTLGVVGHVTRTLSLLYNQSDNFDLPNINFRVLPDSRQPGNPRGKGRDMGITANLLDGKINLRAVRYSSKSVGLHHSHGFGAAGTSPTSFTTLALDALVNAGLIAEAEAEPRRSTANGIIFDRASEGYETTLTANPTKNWRVQANYSYTTNVEENIGLELKAWAAEMLPYLQRFPGTTPAASYGNLDGVLARFQSAMADQFALEGENVGANRRHKVNFFTRYSFAAGPLQGAYIGGGYRHQSKNVAGRNGPQGEFIHGRSYWFADAVLGYRLNRVPVFQRVNLQLNIANLFGERYPLITRRFDNGDIQRWVVIPGRSWRLSASTEF